jgi:hypothetical protein
MPEPGWFDRQLKSVSDEVRAWPDWMKRAAGLEGAPPSPAPRQGREQGAEERSSKRQEDDSST